MITLNAILISLTGGVSAIVGTVLWIALVLVRRLRGFPASVRFHDLRCVWGLSAFLGIPVLFPWMPHFIIETGESILPYLYTLAVIFLAASASILIGTVVSTSTVTFARRTGLLTNDRVDPRKGGWQLRLVWLASAFLGVPLLWSRTSAIIQRLALGFGAG